MLSKAAHAEEGAPVAGSRLMLRNTSTYLEQRRQSSAVFVFAQTTHETTGFTVHCKHTAVPQRSIPPVVFPDIVSTHPLEKQLPFIRRRLALASYSLQPRPTQETGLSSRGWTQGRTVASLTASSPLLRENLHNISLLSLAPRVGLGAVYVGG